MPLRIARLCRSILTSWLVIAAFGLIALPARAEDKSTTQAEAHRQAKSLSLAFRSAAKKVLPTVVTIETRTKPRPSQQDTANGDSFRGTPLEDMFGDPVPESDEGGSPRGAAPNLGSGVIVDPAGIVLTNNHVVSGADEVTVQLGDGQRLKVTDIKVDDQSDLAVIRVETQSPLPAAKLGDSNSLEIGDWVLAIGNPYELERTVSAGIISAKGRSLGAIGRSTYLQTDAAINPGNSGGPLVNLEGEVVGINTAIFSRSGGNQGIGFAIPSDVARWVVPQLVATGKVHRAYLGIALAPLNAERAAKLGVPAGQHGVVVDKVFPNTPATAAGIKENDILTAINGTPLRTTADLQQSVERAQIDSPHRIELLRDSKPLTLVATLRTMPADYGTAQAIPPGEGGSAEGRLYRDRRVGLIVGDLPPPLANRGKISGDSGVLVLRVEPQSISQQAGVRTGMVLSQVGEIPVNNVADYQAAMEGRSLKDGITLQLKTRTGSQTVTLKSP